MITHRILLDPTTYIDASGLAEAQAIRAWWDEQLNHRYPLCLIPVHPCPTCGSPVLVINHDDGGYHFQPLDP